jgi:dynein intermediate chain 4, axonemal
LVQDYFLSCSADWSCKLWDWKEENYKFSFQNTVLGAELYDEILDIEWNPWMSTMFASTSKDGRLELWDLGKSLLDPIEKELSKDVSQC